MIPGIGCLDPEALGRYFGGYRALEGARAEWEGGRKGGREGGCWGIGILGDVDMLYMLERGETSHLNTMSDMFVFAPFFGLYVCTILGCVVSSFHHPPNIIKKSVGPDVPQFHISPRHGHLPLRRQ